MKDLLHAIDVFLASNTGPKMLQLITYHVARSKQYTFKAGTFARKLGAFRWVGGALCCEPVGTRGGENQEMAI